MAESKGLGIEINQKYTILFRRLREADPLAVAVAERELDRSIARQEETIRLLESLDAYFDAQ